MNNDTNLKGFLAGGLIVTVVIAGAIALRSFPHSAAGAGSAMQNAQATINAAQTSNPKTSAPSGLAQYPAAVQSARVAMQKVQARQAQEDQQAP